MFGADRLPRPQNDADRLTEAARTRRAQSWAEQAGAGIESIASNDFTLYDQVLDTVTGGTASTMALRGSTEEEQFVTQGTAV